MTRSLLVFAIATMSLINGMPFLPWFDPVYFYLGRAVPGLFAMSPTTYFYVTTLVIALASTLLSWLPTALYNRMRGRKSHTVVSLGIWLALTASLVISGLWLSDGSK
jgi:hypothetical protein